MASKDKFRLSGKTSMRHPYQAEIVRKLSLEMFLGLRRAAQHSRIRDNKKSQFMSFSSEKTAAVFLAQLSGLSERYVKIYIKKILTGSAYGKASVIVSSAKNVSFIYKNKASQFCISFYYGVWDKARFPLHN